MNNKHYYLYRAKFIRPFQKDLFDKGMTPTQILLNAITERPSFCSKRGTEWLLGNIEFNNDYSGSFALGKNTRTKRERLDKDSRNFSVQSDEEGPFTTVVFDAKIGLIGIAKKSALSPETAQLANKIKNY